MKLSIIITLMWLSCAISNAQRVTGQADVTAPATSKPGEAILFTVKAQPGEEVQWLFLHPRGAGVKTINTTYGIEFIVDPPANYRGPVEVMCQVINWDARTKHVREVVVTVEGARPPPGPDPPDDGGDDPPPDDGVTVDNAYGVGQNAYDTAPAVDKDQILAVAKLFEQSANFLFGKPSLKVIATATDPKKADPSYSIFAWQGQEMKKLIATEPKWREWYQGFDSRIIAAQQSKVVVSRDDWFGAFVEVQQALVKRAGQ